MFSHSNFWRERTNGNRGHQNRPLLDREQIRERSGLLPCAEILSRISRGQYRRSGRTTEMMLDALVELQTKDLILIDSISATESLRIVRDIRRYARGIGILGSDMAAEREVKVLNGMIKLRSYDPDEYRIFTDHSKYDSVRFPTDFSGLPRLSVNDPIDIPVIDFQMEPDRWLEEQRRITEQLRNDFDVNIHQSRSEADRRAINRINSSVDAQNNYRAEYQVEFRGNRSWSEFDCWQESLERRYIERQEYRIGVDTGNLGDSQGYIANISISEKPTVCQGCINYNGSSYGGNLLICGMYPYGCDSDVCPDWEGTVLTTEPLLS